MSVLFRDRPAMAEKPKRPRGRPRSTPGLVTVKVNAVDLEVIREGAQFAGRTIADHLGYLSREYLKNQAAHDVEARLAASRSRFADKSGDKKS